MSTNNRPGVTLLHMPPNEGAISQVWLFVSVDQTGEGICGAKIGDMMMSMVTARESNLENMKKTARALAKASGKKIKLIKLTTREDVMEIEP